MEGEVATATQDAGCLTSQEPQEAERSPHSHGARLRGMDTRKLTLEIEAAD